MTQIKQIVDCLKSNYINHREDEDTCLNCILECILEITPRTTKPSFYNMVIRKDDGLVLVKESPFSSWYCLEKRIYEEEPIYYYKDLLAEILGFCYINNVSLLERKYLVNLISGLIVSQEYIDKNCGS